VAGTYTIVITPSSQGTGDAEGGDVAHGGERRDDCADAVVKNVSIPLKGRRAPDVHGRGGDGFTSTSPGGALGHDGLVNVLRPDGAIDLFHRYGPSGVS